MTKQTFLFILNLINEQYSPSTHGCHQPVSAKVALYHTLWYLGNKCTFREIAEQFGYSESVVHKCVETCIKIICSFTDRFIKWPNYDEQIDVERKFRNVANLPGDIGSCDGSHILIKAPIAQQASYINRTAKHSVNLLAVCNSDKQFTFIQAGFPGSAHDSRVLKSTILYNKMVQNPASLFLSQSHHIIGDSAFPNSRYLLVPYKDYGNLNPQQKKYNTKLSQTRCIIENAFGFLKGRFRRLKYIDADLHRIPDIITACCILHNITLTFPDEEEALLTDCSDEINQVNEPQPVAVGEYDNVHDVAGNLKRDQIAELLL